MGGIYLGYYGILVNLRKIAIWDRSKYTLLLKKVYTVKLPSTRNVDSRGAKMNLDGVQYSP